jgi:hypothetical protein
MPFPGSQSWVLSAFLRKVTSEAASYVSSKTSALKKLLGESNNGGLLCDIRTLESYDAEDFSDDIDDRAISDG